MSNVGRGLVSAVVVHAAAQEGTTVSAWLADTATHRLRLDAGRRGIAQWERKSGALTADELAEEVSPTVPTPVLAEAWRGGGRQANLSRFLALCTLEPMNEQQAKSVGILAGNATTMTSST